MKRVKESFEHFIANIIHGFSSPGHAGECFLFQKSIKCCIRGFTSRATFFWLGFNFDGESIPKEKTKSCYPFYPMNCFLMCFCYAANKIQGTYVIGKLGCLNIERLLLYLTASHIQLQSGNQIIHIIRFELLQKLEGHSSTWALDTTSS